MPRTEQGLREAFATHSLTPPTDSFAGQRQYQNRHRI